MSFTLSTDVAVNAATGLAAGQTCAAYKASRFGSAPTTNTAPPGGGDDGGGTQSSGTAGPLNVAFTVATFEQYYVSSYDPADTSNAGSYNLYWTAAVEPPAPLVTQPVGVATQQATSRALVETHSTTFSQTLPTATLTGIVSTSGFASSGALLIRTSNAGWQVVQYTGTTASTFTGCTGGVGNIATSSAIIQGYQNGVLRRCSTWYLQATVLANNDSAYVMPVTTMGGNLYGGTSIGSVGIQNWPQTATFSLFLGLPINVDPNGWYGAFPVTSGSGVLSLNNVEEIDG